MIVDAVILAGGRGSRLGGVAKAALVVGGSTDGSTLLERTLDAAARARRIVVVGDAAVIAAAAPGRDPVVVREEPPFAGPAAAIAAGVERLLEAGDAHPDAVLVLACDMPSISDAVDALLDAVDARRGAVATGSDGRAQQLAAVYPAEALTAAIRARREEGGLDDLSVRALVDGLPVDPVEVPRGSTDDVDTWDDADRLGATERT